MPFDFFKRILDKNDRSIITFDTIAWAVRMERFGEDIRPKVNPLLERAGPIKVTEDAMIQAVSKIGNCDKLQMLIDRGWPVTQSAVQKLQNGAGPQLSSRSLGLEANSLPKSLLTGLKTLITGLRWSSCLFP